MSSSSISIISAEVEPFVLNDLVSRGWLDEEGETSKRRGLAHSPAAAIVCKGVWHGRRTGKRGMKENTEAEDFRWAVLRSLRRAEIKSYRGKELIRLSLSISPFSVIRPLPLLATRPFRSFRSKSGNRSVAETRRTEHFSTCMGDIWTYDDYEGENLFRVERVRTSDVRRVKHSISLVSHESFFASSTERSFLSRLPEKSRRETFFVIFLGFSLAGRETGKIWSFPGESEI